MEGLLAVAPLQVVESLVETATGPVGLALVFVYSFLVAVVLPLPSELVLAPVPTMRLGVGPVATFAVVVLVSAAGKALGSLAAYRLGRTAVTSRPARWLLRQVVPEPEPTKPDGRVTAFAKRHGWLGLAVVLAVPVLPDTATIYAFSVIDTDQRLFALAAFLGTVVRLVVTALLAAGVLVAL